MKRLLLALLAISLFACSPDSHDKRQFGGEGGGTSTETGEGGNTSLSTDEDILLTVSSLQMRVKIAFAQLRASYGVIQNPKVQGILEAMLNPKAPNAIQAEQDVMQTPYLAVTSEACPHQTPGHEDASTILGRLKSPICFNVASLKHVPKEALRTELVALAAHEHAHHYGFDEEDAVLLQKFFLSEGDWIVQNNSLRESLIESAAEVLGRIQIVQSAGMKPLSDERYLCANLGATVRSGEVLSDLLYRGIQDGDEYNVSVPNETFKKAGLLHRLLVSANNYCLGTNDPPPEGYSPVTYGSTPQLTLRLYDIAALAREVKKQVLAALGEPAEPSPEEQQDQKAQQQKVP